MFGSMYEIIGCDTRYDMLDMCSHWKSGSYKDYYCHKECCQFMSHLIAHCFYTVCKSPLLAVRDLCSAISRMSFTRVVSTSELSTMPWAISFFSSSFRPLSSWVSSRENPTIALSGVRKSSLIFCRNNVLRRSDSCARSIATLSSLMLLSSLALTWFRRFTRKRLRNTCIVVRSINTRATAIIRNWVKCSIRNWRSLAWLNKRCEAIESDSYLLRSCWWL